MNKAYNHESYETAIYRKWEEKKTFTPPSAKVARERGKKPFTIIMPPPNANDPLHIGHAMFITIEDILVRFHRMKGEATLWLPGTDHAGIETQYVFEKKLNKQGKSRFNYDREALYQMIWEYVEENSGVAINQMKRLGASADWTRLKFTLDEDCVDLTLATFERMHEEGLIERKLALVNYCTRCGTAYSQLEVKHEERNSPLYYLKYGPFELATVRPETKFGDTAIAVNPKDKRYRQWIGQEIEVKGLLGRFKMKVIADDYVDPEFGTGVVKITPAHDPNDFEVWQRHKKEIPGPKQVIGFDGKLTAEAGKYAGLRVEEARKKVVDDLKKQGLLIRVDDQYLNNVATCYRCGRVIEPLPMAQFFIKVASLTEKTLSILDGGEVKIMGAGHDKILRHWLLNLKDWNISRQIVWGIRMPIWYNIDDNPDLMIGFLNQDGKYVSGKVEELLEQYDFGVIEAKLQTTTAPEGASYKVSRTKPKSGGRWLQETDTFDTWFSSAQWPVNTLKTTSKGDFEFFYPTSVMETGYDILPFWVMRMLMMGLYLTNQSPFQTVYLHGLVRDAKGQKMSKSKGNVINPLEVVSKYGADALRLALVIRSTPGIDKSVGESDFKAARNLTNKLWNAARFVILQAEEELSHKDKELEEDKAFYKMLGEVISEVTVNLEKNLAGLTGDLLYNHFWHWFCDECIEKNKSKKLSLRALRDGLITFLKLWHPFVPFVTEAIWQEMRAKNILEETELLIEAEWPKVT